MTAAVTIAALPAAALVLWGLLRSTLGDRLVAEATGDRWHARPTPTFGGVGIFAGLLAGIGLAVASGAIDATWKLGGIVLGCGILFLAGVLDDLRNLSPVTKLAAQLGAAAVAIGSGLQVELVGNDVAATAIAVVWLVGITNAFNLLDNMDGLAATLAAVGCAYFAIDAATAHPNDLVLVLALSIGLACLGFLPFNLRPGRSAAVFMGDAGSQVLGFGLACLGLASSWTAAGTTVATVLLPLIVLAIPILDTSLVTIVRLLERRPVTQGGRDHTSHRLVYSGLSEAKAVGLLALVAVVLGATGLAYNALDNARVTAVGVLLSVVLLVQFGSFLTDLREHQQGDGTSPSLWRALVEPRRLIEIVADFVLMCASFLGSYLFVVEGLGTPVQRAAFLASLPVLLGSRYLCFVLGGIYRRIWRYATAADELVIALACVVSAAAAWLIVRLTQGLAGFPLSVFVLDAMLCTLLVGGSRVGFRLWIEHGDRDNRRSDAHRVLVVGAGRSGRSFARELRETPGTRVVGFVDDNPAIHGRRVAGTRVLGSLDEASRVLQQASPDEVFVTIANVPPDRLTAVIAACDAARIPCRVLHRRIETASDAIEVPAE